MDIKKKKVSHEVYSWEAIPSANNPAIGKRSPRLRRENSPSWHLNLYPETDSEKLIDNRYVLFVVINDAPIEN